MFDFCVCYRFPHFMFCSAFRLFAILLFVADSGATLTRCIISYRTSTFAVWLLGLYVQVLVGYNGPLK